MTISKGVERMVLDDDLIRIAEKNPEERTEEERQAYLKYLEGVWKGFGGKKKTQEVKPNTDNKQKE